MNIRRLFTSLLALALVGCSGKDIPPADVVYTNTTVHTMNEAQATAEAVVVSGNKIIMVGSSQQAKPLLGQIRKYLT